MERTVADVVAELERWCPPGTADGWDRVGLVVGDPAAPVRHVHLAVDPTLGVVEEAIARGADLLVTHHPLLLRGVHSVATTSAKGATVTAAIRGNLALYAMHTNADKAPGGVAEALAEACGLLDTVPLVAETAPDGTAIGAGRLGRLPSPGMPLRALIERLAAALPPTAGGIRVAGDPEAVVRTVAVLGGAGDGYIDTARAAGADVYITADLRHHPVLEARESDRWATPYLVDAGHWATEWLWLAHAERRLRATLRPMTTSVSMLRTDPWTFVVDTQAPGGPQ